MIPWILIVVELEVGITYLLICLIGHLKSYFLHVNNDFFKYPNFITIV